VVVKPDPHAASPGVDQAAGKSFRTASDDPNNPFDGPVGGTRAGIDLAKLLSDPQRSDGSAVGFNPDTTVAQNQTFTYTFMADKELGTSIFLNGGSQASQLHGAYGVLIVEPEGASWFDTRTGAGLDDKPATQAIVRSPSGNFRELAVMPSTTDTQNGRSVIGRARNAGEGGDAYEDDVIGLTSINYHNEPLAPRLDPEGDLAAFSWEPLSETLPAALPVRSLLPENRARHRRRRSP
jgi:hypothetical protein